ncbi:MAG: hypothetical protein ACO3NK_03645 [Prochlorotrichaceae cyanobacterium]
MSNAIEDLETLANALGGETIAPDFEVTEQQLKEASRLSQEKVKLEKPPETLAEAGELLPVKVSGTTVKTRIILIADRCYIPLKYLATQEGNRMTGLTALGWAILKDMPHEKGSAREEYFDLVDDRYSDFLPELEDNQEAEVVEAEEISDSEFAAIVKRKTDGLSTAVQDAVTLQPLVNFGDFTTLKILARQVGRVMGQQLGAEVSAGMNEGMLSAQQGIRAGMLQSTEGIE